MYSESVNSAPGSVSQVREATGILMQLAKELGYHDFYRGSCDERGRGGRPQSIWSIWWTPSSILKETAMLPTGCSGESRTGFGSTNEIGVFEMQEQRPGGSAEPLGIHARTGGRRNASGSVVACSMEGTRPILVEIQALVCQSNQFRYAPPYGQR